MKQRLKLSIYSLERFTLTSYWMYSRVSFSMTGSIRCIPCSTYFSFWYSTNWLFNLTFAFWEPVALVKTSNLGGSSSFYSFSGMLSMGAATYFSFMKRSNCVSNFWRRGDRILLLCFAWQLAWGDPATPESSASFFFYWPVMPSCTMKVFMLMLGLRPRP